MGLPRREVVKIRDHISSPLAEERSIGLEPNMGRIWEADREVVARAEDVRVLAFYGESAAVDPKYTDPTAPDECQAWVVLEHPADLTPNVSVVFHNPEGLIDRHYPTSQSACILTQGWNDCCYTGPELDIEDALEDAGLIEEDGTSHVLALYRFSNDESQSFDRWFPGHPEVSTITTVNPYDQLFLIMDSPMSWTMDIMADPIGQKDTQVSLIQGWNSVCYAGPDSTPAGATSSIAGGFPIMYTVASDQSWRRYVPEYPWATNINTLSQYTSVSMPVTAPGGAIWEFDPLAAPNLSPPPEATPASPSITPALIPSQVVMCAVVLPGTYLGTVTVDGLPAPDGTTVTASLGGIIWAIGTTSGGLYVFDVPAHLPTTEPCFAGGEITFTADGEACQESPAWSSGLHVLNLDCGAADTDNDGFSDVQESTLGSDPLNAASTPEHISLPVTCTDGSDNDLDGLPDLLDCDNDGDGIANYFDPCPFTAEDMDGYQDADGCPDTDNDMDGICDPWAAPIQPACFGSDACPNISEDYDTYRDADGCPEADNDSDSFPDSTDDCPGTDWTAGPDGIADNGDEPPDEDGVPIQTKEDYDGIIDFDGCHDSPGDDWDGDGSADEVEVFVGTDPADTCSWPPDFDNNHVVDMFDVLNVAGRFGSSQGHPLYSQRYDLDGNGSIGMTDVLWVAGLFAAVRPECGSG
jgi:hypothetical protein